jgi:hypothetical protein
MIRKRIRISEELYNRISASDLDNSDILRRMVRKIYKDRINSENIPKAPPPYAKMICSTFDDKYKDIDNSLIRDCLEVEFVKNKRVPIKISKSDMNEFYSSQWVIASC